MAFGSEWCNPRTVSSIECASRFFLLWYALGVRFSQCQSTFRELARLLSCQWARLHERFNGFRSSFHKDLFQDLRIFYLFYSAIPNYAEICRMLYMHSMICFVEYQILLLGQILVHRTTSKQLIQFVSNRQQNFSLQNCKCMHENPQNHRCILHKDTFTNLGANFIDYQYHSLLEFPTFIGNAKVIP